MTYNEFISQFQIYNNPTKKKGLHRHHIVPRSKQIETDNRCVYVTPAQHLWLHILYDQENGTHTACKLLGDSHIKKDDIHCYEDCLKYNEIDALRRKELSKANKGEKNPRYGTSLTEETRKKLSVSLKGKPTWNKGVPITEETRKKISGEKNGAYGKKWWTDGVNSVLSKECPEGYRPGMAKKRKSA